MAENQRLRWISTIAVRLAVRAPQWHLVNILQRKLLLQASAISTLA
jgi:hypothetical protein